LRYHCRDDAGVGACRQQRPQEEAIMETQRIALVTGGMGGLGEAICIKLAALGNTVVTTHSPGNTKRDEWLASMKRQGFDFRAYACDVADFDSSAACVKHVMSELGPIDVLVNNAGITRDMTFRKMDKANWDAVMQTNLDSCFNMAKQVCDGMVERGWGRIINISSVNGQKGAFGQTNYSAAKAGVVGFTLTAAQELARYGVTVNAIGPGGRTRMTENAFPGAMGGDRSGWDPFDPENVAPVVAWLASAGSKAVTGRVIEAWGGRLAVIDGWRPGRVVEQARRWEPEEVGPVITELIAELPPPASMVPDTD
jgi:acetoacetyl-CoA reductase